jgi:hypothetical protein
LKLKERYHEQETSYYFVFYKGGIMTFFDKLKKIFSKIKLVFKNINIGNNSGSIGDNNNVKKY